MHYCKYFFGVCLQTFFYTTQEHKGRGTSNGEFRNHRYFTCPDDCGVFVSLDKLTLHDDSLESKKSSHSVGNKIKNKVLGMFGPKGGENGKQMDQKELLSIMTEHVGKRVVTYVGETPVRGFLRALGTSSHGIAVAGIELVWFLKFKVKNETY